MPAVRALRVEPSEMPEIVELCNWLLPMVEVATTEPLLKTERRELDNPVMARLVVVAWVEVELVAVKFCKVVEPLKRTLVKVARSEVRLPMMPVLARRSVVLALLEMKRSVAVAFCKVEEAVARKLEV